LQDLPLYFFFIQNLSIESNSKPATSSPFPYNRIYFNTPRSSKLTFPLKCSRNIEHIFPSFPCLMHIYSFYTPIVINLSILFEDQMCGASYHIPSTFSRSFRTSLFTCAFILFLYSISCLRTVWQVTPGFRISESWLQHTCRTSGPRIVRSSCGFLSYILMFCSVAIKWLDANLTLWIILF